MSNQIKMSSIHRRELPCSTSGRLEDYRCNAKCNRGLSRETFLGLPVGSFALRPTPPSALRTLRAAATSQPAAIAESLEYEDKWIRQLLSTAAPPPGSWPALSELHTSCVSALATMRMPTTRNEEYRFTDLSSLLKTPVTVPEAAQPDAILAAVGRHGLMQEVAARIVVVDGVVDSIHTENMPNGSFIGRLSDAPQDITRLAFGAQSQGRGGPFATINGALARDAVVIHLPINTNVSNPIHLLYLSSSPVPGSTAQRAITAPRVLVCLEEGAFAEVIEEFAPLVEGTNQGSYLVSAVFEAELDDRAELRHGYLQLESPEAIHFKATLINQGASSRYSVTEARLGGALTRHDLSIDQLGKATESEMRSFLLAGANQLQDLHSKLRLEYPEGRAEQLHKCIAMHPSSRAVFDGNVRVGKGAQQTDAQQLSRNLLLAPRATVNVKPNLQIIADDVKCTHGCTVSDLEDEELFYLRSRGINQAAARRILVYSFGREVVCGLKDDALLDRIEKAATATLKTASVDWEQGASQD